MCQSSTALLQEKRGAEERDAIRLCAHDFVQHDCSRQVKGTFTTGEEEEEEGEEEKEGRGGGEGGEGGGNLRVEEMNLLLWPLRLLNNANVCVCVFLVRDTASRRRQRERERDKEKVKRK